MTSKKMENHVKAGEIHKQVQIYAREIVVPGCNLMDAANRIEHRIRELTKYDASFPLAGGVAFPTGLSVNNCAAHWTPNPTDLSVIFGTDDLIKVDFGVQIQGCIVDGAISIAATEELQQLVDLSEEATALAIKAAGVDARVYDIGCAVEEFIESHELEINGSASAVHSIADLCGHQIGKYMIHMGKPVPNVRFDAIKSDERYKMRAGEVYAIEPYPTTGSGRLVSDPNPSQCSHFMANYMDRSKYNVKTQHPLIAKEFGTLAFCKRWLTDEPLKALNRLVAKGVYSAYPPLYSEKGTFVAQTEKTISVTDAGVQVLN